MCFPDRIIWIEKMNRRFVNLVLGDCDSRMHSLFRLDVAKHLFYHSTAQAEAANAKQETNNGGGGDDKPVKAPTMQWPKPPRIKWLRLPKPTVRFSQFDAGDKQRRGSWWPSNDDAFMLLRPNSSEGTILHATEGGRNIIYDADEQAISATVPSFGTGMGPGPIAFSVPGAGGEGKESIYVMRSTISSHVRDRYSSPRNNVGSSSAGEEDRCSGDFVVLDMNQQPYKWQHLPRPPFVVEKEPDERGLGGLRFSIRSSAVIDGGRTIVVSSDKEKRHYGGHVTGVDEFTYCFDTVTREWRHAGDWALPFVGRAEYVPELGTWIGFSSNPPHHLCAADLSSAMDAGGRAQTPQHVWDDFTPPPDETSEVELNRRYPGWVLKRSTSWSPSDQFMVNLGSGRFCTLKTFCIRRDEWIGFSDCCNDREIFAVITGVEVVRGHDGEEEEGGLRMVKHKSKRCSVTSYHYWLF